MRRPSLVHQVSSGALRRSTERAEERDDERHDEQQEQELRERHTPADRENQEQQHQ